MRCLWEFFREKWADRWGSFRRKANIYACGSRCAHTFRQQSERCVSSYKWQAQAMLFWHHRHWAQSNRIWTNNNSRRNNTNNWKSYMRAPLLHLVDLALLLKMIVIVSVVHFLWRDFVAHFDFFFFFGIFLQCTFLSLSLNFIVVFSIANW